MEISAQNYLIAGTLLCGYVIGSIPFAVIISRMNGVNILKVNSGNPGATNVRRSVGKWAGNTVFILDFLKGFIPTALVQYVFLSKYKDFTTNLNLVLIGGLILGHNFSIFLKFRGGKGIATTMGGLLAIMPGCFGIGILTWLVIFKATRFVSLASISFVVSLPLTSYLFGYSNKAIIFCIVLMVIAILKHKSNIKRLWEGTEYRFSKNNREDHDI
ncbi:MAG: glycerol-3-phosphate 1-O-acyltransferase PlsY [Puniceicoccales bacterium]|jgi:glycerol-3-phosphate acyltransferase PlsY|nr:glycerol-3-phosphate 1-O-acyltransferase PlsY [Puniceicoccales bacterium]